MRAGPFAFRYQVNGATPCQYIDTTRKAIDCATTLPLTVFGRPFVKRFAVCYRTVVMSCLSVTFVHCSQTAGRIKMKLGTQVGLDPRHIVLDGDPAPPPPKGGGARQIFGPCLLWPNGWMDQDGTWHGRRPQPWRLCVRWGPSPPPPEGSGAPLPNFRPISIVTKRLDAPRCQLVWR